MRPLLTFVAATAALAAPATLASTQFTPEGARDGWIVVLKDDAPHGAFLRTRDIAAAAGFVPRHTFNLGPSLRGHVMAGPGSEIAVQQMADSPYVDFIQPDTKISLDDSEDNAGLGDDDEGDSNGPVQPGEGVENGSHVTAPTESWGLHRLSHGPLTPGESLEYRRNATGRTGWVYIVDTGIELGHPQFGGRAKWGATFLKKSSLGDRDE
ncbi:peptidase S8/S53 domain-containing protein [Apiospora arundinis]